MADLLFIVSRTDARTYAYVKHALAGDSVDVFPDRRAGDRRRIREWVTPDRRRYGDRRTCDVTTNLRAYGWALVHR